MNGEGASCAVRAEVAIDLVVDRFSVRNPLERHGQQQEGALKGYNPRRPGRLSHHPLLAVLAESHFVMHGWLRVDAEGLRTEAQLRPWVERGVAYARSLPAKR